MTGCRVGAANRLTKNYLWFAEKGGVQIMAEREVVDVRTVGNPEHSDGSDGYRIRTRRPGPGLARDRRDFTTRGVVFAAGTMGSNELLADCKERGSLPRLSDRLGQLVRTNSEAVLTVLLPEDMQTWRDVTASSRVMVDDRTQIEFLTYGPRGDFMKLLFTLKGAGDANRWPLIRWALEVVRHPRRWAATMKPGWGRRTLMMLVMQARDNAIELVPVRRRFSHRYRLTTALDAHRPPPVNIPIGDDVANWLANRMGGIPQASVFEVLGNRSMTAHVVGGAVIGTTAETGVLGPDLSVFGYQNMIVCDAAALPANPGVNPALTITALAEHAMQHIEPRPTASSPDEA